MNTPPSSRPTEERQVVTLLRFLLIGLCLTISWLVLRYLAQILAPVLAALGIAYLLDPLVERLVKRGVSRTLSTSVVLGVFIGGLVLTLMALLPRVVHEIARFIEDLPTIVDSLTVWARRELGIEVPVDWQQYLKSDEVSSGLADAVGPLRELAGAALSGVFALVATLASLLLVPVFAFYFLVDWPHVKARITKLIPPRRRARLIDIADEIDGVISGWVRGQAIVTTILAFLYAVCFTIVGIHLAIPIGLVVGALTVIPFVGTFVGAAIAIGVTLLDWQGVTPIIAVSLIILVLHALEAMVLTPKIVGHRVGLSESAALFAVVAGGELLGFVGVVLAVPIAATCAVLIRHGIRYYETTAFFGDEADAVVNPGQATALISPSVPPAEPKP